MKEVTNKMQKRFDLMCKTGMLFKSKLSGNEVWDIYLKSFKNGDDPTFRDPESTTHTCNNCNNFIKRYGNVVAIDMDGNIMTIFDITTDDEVKNSFKLLSKKLKSSEILDVFFETVTSLKSLPYEKNVKSNQKTYRLGIEKNVKRYTVDEAKKFGVVEADEIRTFHHYHLDLPKQFVNNSGDSIEKITAFYRDKKDVFERCMIEIPLDTLNLVRDLINQGSLLDGTAHLHSVEEIITLKNNYETTPINKKLYNWVLTYSIEERTAKFKKYTYWYSL